MRSTAPLKPTRPLIRRGAAVAAMGLAAGALAAPAVAAGPEPRAEGEPTMSTTSLQDAADDVNDATFICRFAAKLPYLCPQD